MKTDKIRQEYLYFFQEKSHKLVSSDSLVCTDASVLFTSAGMNQFKPYFLGQKKDLQRAVSCQRCLRTGDIEQVGKTPFHHTFFEMLGNFSFGDYFKEEAIQFAWDFLTQRLKINPKQLFVSVYKDDQEAFDIWQKQVGIPVSKIFKFGQDQNFWPANVLELGPNGPCGPCAEIFFDKGSGSCCKKKSCDPSCDCGRFVEIWNLVFTQFDRKSKGCLQPLPQKNIDTGMGLERIASVLQKKDSNFKIDILYPVVEAVKKILGPVKQDQENLVNSIVDHSRAVTFAIADGVYPSNEERGYVVRKLLRKSLWTADLLNYKNPFIYRLIPLFIQLMQPAYPFLEEKSEVLERVVKTEEEKFLLTLEAGKNKLKVYLKNLKKEKRGQLGADKLFQLYDTYGFPFELTQEIAKKNKVSIDQLGAEKELARQRERSRAGSRFSENIFEKDSSFFVDLKPTNFIGYEQTVSQAQIIKIFPLNKEKIDWQKPVDLLQEKEAAALILDQTPFYPESGGQLSDQGIIETAKGKFFVQRVEKGAGSSVYLHQGEVVQGSVKKGQAKAEVDKKRRRALARAHTATHLLQVALRRILGEHVSQQGSLVDVDRLRFDFTHFQALTRSQIEAVEDFVNFSILSGDQVSEAREISLEAAKKSGALAFFKEKYKEKVRMITIAEYSKELCGGTHLNNTSEVGGFSLVAESSVSSGVRRVEAVVGERFYQLLKEKKKILGNLATTLKSNPAAIEPALGRVLEELKDNQAKVAQLEKEKISAVAGKLLADFLENQFGKNILVYDFSKKGDSFKLKYSSFFVLLDLVKEHLESFFVFFVGKSNGQVRFLCSCSKDLERQGLSSKDFISSWGSQLFLRGGGSSRLVQGVISKKEADLSSKVKDCFIRWVQDESSKKS